MSSPPRNGYTNSTGKNNCGGNTYSPEQVCGSGFSTIDSATLGTPGSVQLLDNSSTKANYVTTLKSVSLGQTTPVSALLQAEGGTRQTDSGNVGYFAGPVNVGAGSTCVRWGGSAGTDSYSSPFEHCGQRLHDHSGNRRQKPGRKRVIHIGPGYPQFSNLRTERPAAAARW